MQEITRSRATWIGARARAPLVARVLALLALFGGIAFIGVSVYRSRGVEKFVMRGGAAELSKDVVRVVEGYEHREMKDNRLHILLRASREITYTDGHHELEDVSLEVYPETGDRPDRVTAKRTIITDQNMRVLFTGDVNVETRDALKAKTESINYDIRNEVGVSDVPLTFERENVHGRADAATVDAKNKKLDLRGNVEIVVEPKAKDAVAKPGARERPITIRSPLANFDQNALTLVFSGGATAEQEQDVFSGDILTGFLNAAKKIERIEARGNSYLRSLSDGHAAEVHSADMDFLFDPDQKIKYAKASRDARGRSLDADAEVAFTTPGDAFVDFTPQGERSLISRLVINNRPVITLAAPKSKAGDPNAANKRLISDSVRLFWRATGKDLERAEAEGNAELYVEPVTPSPTADRKTLTAPRFDGDFYEAGNLAKTFVAQGGAKAVIDPIQPSETRATRTLTSARMTANFVRETQDVERIDADGDARFVERERTLTSQKMEAVFGQGQAMQKVEAKVNAKFNERDRNGEAATMTYTAGDEVVRLRGGEPVVWDARARLKAPEIDSDMRNKISYARGRVATTYYSQEQTGGAAPFKKTKSPIFIASQDAEFQHETGVGIYTGAARAWQDDNFVKADRLTLRREQKRMEGDGNVQSALYQARRKDAAGNRSVVPVFATSARMFYADPERLLHYETSVDIKQGTERIMANAADVYLQPETYEAERTVAQGNVVVTQPGRRGTGDWAQYTAADESVVLTGNPARVEDAAKGDSASNRMTVYLREDRIVSDAGESKQSTGRVRSSHKIKKQ
ncbi:MAG TPA: LPS export ABC transporter periplasmic protein LptC [Pyrinomonadaceae bacterium]